MEKYQFELSTPLQINLKELYKIIKDDKKIISIYDKNEDVLLI